MADTHTRLCGMLGFAMRAGRLTLGTEQVCLAMAKHGEKKPCLILLSQNASDATQKKVTVKSRYYGIDVRLCPLTPEEIGRLLGKKSAPVTVGVHDPRFAKELAACCERTPIIATKGSFRTPAETGESDGSTEND